MIYTILFYILLLLFILALLVSWLSNLFGLPGNWFIVALTAVWFFFTSAATHWHIELGLVVLFAVLAGIGELIEFGASVLGTKHVGGSRRAATCSIIGSIVGGIAGGFIGIPIPIPLVGIVIGSVFFACLGALIGATIGEKWQGSEMDKSLKVGGAAAAGRFVGTMGKIAMGSAIAAVVLLSLFI